MDEETFEREASSKIWALRKVWNAAIFRIGHKDQRNRWAKAPFCECNPYTGHFAWKHIGNRPTHEIKEKDNRPKGKTFWE